MTTLRPPLLASDLPAEWFLALREAQSRSGTPIRANPTRACIDVWSTNRGVFMPLLLPGGGTEFANVAERDAVILKLEGK